ncbi:MAG: hypothetical protein ACK4J0_01110 [Candidatus Anstonellaceae archaeon]
MSFDYSDVLHKKEVGAVEKFKIKSTILKDLGPNALRVYNAIDSSKSVQELITLLEIEEKEFFEIITFLEKMNFIYKNEEESLEKETLGKEEEQPQQQEVSDTSSENFITSLEQRKMENKTPQDSKEISKDSLSAAEKEIFQKYGDIGLKVYSLIDGYRSAQEIMEEASISESLLIEMLNFMESKGIITLEDKSQDQDVNETRTILDNKKESPKRTPTSPFVETQPLPPSSKDIQPGEILVPSLKNLSVLDSTKLKVLLKLKYNLSSDFLKFLDGKSDIIDLFFNFNLSIPKLKQILSELQQEGYLTLSSLSREEIENKYSHFGLTAYKKFGLDGVLLYSFIGKTTSLPKLIKKAELDVQKVSDILLFLSSILGVDLKIDKQKLLENLKKSDT